MILEPLQGYGGIFPLENGYIREAFNLIHDYGGVTISDEVQTGYGRCGSAFLGFQLAHNQVVPDIITMAKGWEMV
jgi:alanine-glyoxylate transaminase / (R)-3-amino-2-methylpropionate-pyruvate transaminase